MASVKKHNGLKLNADFEGMKELFTLISQFKGIGGRVLKYIGKSAMVEFYEQLLRGQKLKLVNFTRVGNSGFYARKDGRKLINNKLNRKYTQVRITSIIANLFEEGRLLRSGRKEKGKYLLTDELKKIVNSKLEGWASDVSDQIIKGTLERVA